MPTIDITNAQELTKAVNNEVDARRFLTSFFKPLDHNTRDVIIDFVEGSQKLAPFVRDGDSATVSHRGGYKSRFVHAYGIEIKRPTHAFDCLKRLPGEVPVSSKAASPSVRAAELAGRDLKELKNKVYRTVEKIVSDSFFNGSFDITDKDNKVIDSVDLGRSESHSISKEWGASYDGITTDLEEMATLINEDSGLTATDIIVGKNVWAKMLKNTKFMKDLDTRNLDGIRAAMNFKMEGNGARLVGSVGGTVRLWRYDEIFKDASGNKVSMVPENKVLMLSDVLQATLHRGVVGDNDIGWFEGEFAADTWYEKDPSVQWLRLRSAPLPICEQIDATCVATIA